MKNIIVTATTRNPELAQDTRILNQAVDNCVTDIVKHFSDTKYFSPVEDERYVYNSRILSAILDGLGNKSKVTVTPLYDKQEFFCYRLDRN